MATILVVDDSALIRTMLKGILSGQGHTVLEAVDGEDALQVFAEKGADLVFLDIFMPGKEGLQTIKELLETSPGLPIVAISAGSTFTDTETLSWAKNYGAKMTLPKPLEAREVINAVKTLVS
ncbi:response regulator [Desulfovibrio inopinatus]|uniref:response regulator n=1 Tax=Desulfovibrio inopinatus TaxID=102109 RepID=UPI000416851E|nr:response regulator [Desulfovibrio inopinatus]